MKRIANVVGARPNFMKMAPVHRALGAYDDVQSVILHTGQHYDRLMSDVFFEDLALPEPHFYLGIGSGTHAEQTAGIMVAFEKQVLSERPDAVAVYGDVNSTMACAVVCAKLGIPLAHVEAGLRSFDRTMPEEINRIVTDHLSELLLITEPSGRRNLEREGISASKMLETGNAMIDSLVGLLRREGISGRLPHAGRPRVLVTLHRPSNVDDPARLRDLAELLVGIAQDSEVVFPVHPRTRDRLGGTPYASRLAEAVRLEEPLRYRHFIWLLVQASLVVTDSGGIQEESAYLGVPCLTLRASTERPITVEAGTNRLESDCGGDLLGAARDLMARALPGPGENPVLIAANWDGNAGERVAASLRRLANGTTGG